MLHVAPGRLITREVFELQREKYLSKKSKVLYNQGSTSLPSPQLPLVLFNSKKRKYSNQQKQMSKLKIYYGNLLIFLFDCLQSRAIAKKLIEAAAARRFSLLRQVF